MAAAPTAQTTTLARIMIAAGMRRSVAKDSQAVHHARVDNKLS
jgi:hypothetical protein